MVKQFLHPQQSFEIENLYEDYSCPSCLQPITNPICHNCLGIEIERWLSFYPSVKKKLMPKLKSYIKKVNNDASSNVVCFSCQSKKAALCPYCFTEGVLYLLKKNNINKNIIGDFLTFFNFDLQKEGYIQEAMKEKLY